MSEVSAKEVNAMKRVLLALALIGLGAGLAYAQPDNLTNGVFLTHYPPGLVYTTDISDWCAQYPTHAITDFTQQNPNIPDSDGHVWYVLAAWNLTEPAKVWCGTEFGFGAYDGTAFAFVASGQCPTDCLVIPTAGWPGPNQGIAIAATATPWTGNFQPVYWFAGYAYYPGVMPLGPNPATAFGGFANCLTPPTPYPAYAFGAMGLLGTPGIAVPEPPPSGGGVHACCVGMDCVLVNTTDECLALGGVDHPEWGSCDGNPCFVETPAVCCVGHECSIVLEADCILMGGHFLPDQFDCNVTPSPCDQYTPVEPSSWGAIKAIYR